MYIFLRFLLTFLYLELAFLLFSLLLEIYRMVIYRYAKREKRSKFLKRRVLKEITSITKNNSSEFFDYNFFLVSIILFSKFL